MRDVESASGSVWRVRLLMCVRALMRVCRVQSVEEQVDFLLAQACSADNLCEMYEGWTPWI